MLEESESVLDEELELELESESESDEEEELLELVLELVLELELESEESDELEEVEESVLEEESEDESELEEELDSLSSFARFNGEFLTVALERVFLIVALSNCSTSGAGAGVVAEVKSEALAMAAASKIAATDKFFNIVLGWRCKFSRLNELTLHHHGDPAPFIHPIPFR